MNRNLLVFSLFIIAAGLAFGLYIITFFGLLLLIPALAAPSRPPARNAPQQPAKQQPQPWGRVIPPRPSPLPSAPTPSHRNEPTAPQMQPMATMATSYVTPSPSPTQIVSHTPALFPLPLLPAMSVMGSAPQPAKSPQETRNEGRDELVEVGALLAVLKIIFG